MKYTHAAQTLVTYAYAAIVAEACGACWLRSCSELTRRRGVGPRGSVVNVVDDVNLSETVKVFLLTNMDPAQPSPVFVHMRSGERANDRNDFLQFIITCLRNGQLVAGDVLVLDNAPIHVAADIMVAFARLMAFAQVSVCFLPSYSPELNPCELVFAQCKHYLRYHRRMHYPFWYEVARGFAETSRFDMSQYYYKCIWNV